MKGLWIGRSIGHNIEQEKFEHETNSNITYSKAYTVDFDNSAHFPSKNLVQILPKELEKDQYDWIGIQSGSIEISNMNTKGDPVEMMKNWKEAVFESSEKIFKVALSAIKNYSNLQCVIIEKRIPRCDPAEFDMNGVFQHMVILYINSFGLKQGALKKFS